MKTIRKYNSTIVDTLNSFQGIDLKGMDQVKLMNRLDRKYWFRAKHLTSILNAIRNDYFVLEIAGERSMTYVSRYFDTVSAEMFTAHHNGRRTRYKIRKRLYKVNNTGFLEVKFKNNKGRTIKKRIPTSDFQNFTTEEEQFIQEATPFDLTNLSEAMDNQFTRVTLVNKDFSERCTIDRDVFCSYGGRTILLDKLIVLEIKASSSSKNSPLAKVLAQHRIRTSGFSKYAIGKSLVDQEVKHNAFKQKIRMIEKTCHQQLLNN